VRARVLSSRDLACSCGLLTIAAKCSSQRVRDTTKTASSLIFAEASIERAWPVELLFEGGPIEFLPVAAYEPTGQDDRLVIPLGHGSEGQSCIYGQR
jgi:hypothetical protein